MRAATSLGGLALVLVACSDPAPPVEVASGRLVARITPEPAQITLLLDGADVWSTRAGGQAGATKHDPPHGFAAIGSRATQVEMQFGSFKFTEQRDAEVWQAIDELADVTATDDGATFALVAGGSRVGTGRLTFVTATRSGPDPDAAGFPRHVRIELDAGTAQRIQVATPCATDEHLLGLGGQSFDVDHRGETVPLFVQEDGIGKDAAPDDDFSGLWFFRGRKHTTHTPMPMLVSSRGYALAVRTDAKAVFALCSERPDAARFEAWEGRLDVNVFVGDGARGGTVAGAATRDALGHMIAWVGKAPRPPLSVFAPWVDAIFGSANVRRVAQALRANGIPAAAIWTEDWRGGGDGATGYALDEDWRVDRDLYPDFEQLAADLHGQGFAFLTYHNTFVDNLADIHDEAVAGGYVVKDGSGGPYTFSGVTLGPSKLLDLANPAAVAWGKRVMGEAVDLGSDGWMADFAEWLPTDGVLASGEDALAVHNRYPVDWVKMTKDILAPRAGRLPPLYFVRAAWIGSQPHVQVLWPGDQQTDFSDGDGLPSVIPMGLNLGLAGFPYVGSDIAGYMSQTTVPTTQELFFRWVTFGALQPVMRTHHGRSARMNYQWEADAGATAHFRRWARLHMQLAAYLYGSSGSYERDGLPLLRLIALDYPDEPWAWTTIDEYLLGDRILVAPVQVPGATSRTVTLPAGRWVPLLGGSSVDGGEHTATAPITEIPAYVPEGTLLVLYPDGVDTTHPAPALPSAVIAGDDREVWLYPGTATHPALARWHDTDGPAAAVPQWTWSGRPAGPAASATFNGVAVPVSNNTVDVIGDGTLSFAGGGTLTIARGLPTARTRVVLK